MLAILMRGKNLHSYGDIEKKSSNTYHKSILSGAVTCYISVLTYFKSNCVVFWVKLMAFSDKTQWVGHLTHKSEVLGSKSGLATFMYFRFSFCCFKRSSCQLLVKVCAQSNG